MSKFKKGDFIRIRGGRNIVQVDEVTDGRYAVHGKQEFYTIYSDGADYDIEHLSPKTAFLAELKELLAKYDASIYPNGCVVDGIGFKVGNEDIYYNMNYGFGDFITADNINDYD